MAIEEDTIEGFVLLGFSLEATSYSFPGHRILINQGN